ncbi:MAG: AraC family transcriptional regulator [Lentisphaeria bacterium]|nr:AraC family transcriptional regulator [Lentisphaeria bacterium]
MDTFHFEQLLCDYEKAFDIFITVHDELGQLRGLAEQNPLIGRHLHKHPYCKHLRNKREGELLCTQNCVSRINSIFNSNEQLRTYTLCCWKGICEVITTIRYDGVRMLTLFAGTFRQADNECPLSDEKSQRFYDSLPILTEDREKQLHRVLYTLGLSLMALLRNSESAKVPSYLSSRQGYIKNFIRHNAHNSGCSLHKLAHELCLSVSRSGHMVKEECGENFHDLLMRERIERAKQLLLTTDLQLEQIAERTGFQSGSYFSRIFHQKEGISPGRYRRRAWNKISNLPKV